MLLYLVSRLRQIGNKMPLSIQCFSTCDSGRGGVSSVCSFPFPFSAKGMIFVCLQFTYWSYFSVNCLGTVFPRVRARLFVCFRCVVRGLTSLIRPHVERQCIGLFVLLSSNVHSHLVALYHVRASLTARSSTQYTVLSTARARHCSAPWEVATGVPLAEDKTEVKRSCVKCRSSLRWLTALVVQELKLVLFFSQEKNKMCPILWRLFPDKTNHKASNNGIKFLKRWGWGLKTKTAGK